MRIGLDFPEEMGSLPMDSKGKKNQRSRSSFPETTGNRLLGPERTEGPEGGGVGSGGRQIDPAHGGEGGMPAHHPLLSLVFQSIYSIM